MVGGTGFTIPPGAPATREQFFSVQQGGQLGDMRVRTIPDGTTFQLTFAVPWDYTALVSLSLICVPGPGAVGLGKSIPLDSDYASAGEAYNTHSETNPAFTTDFATPDLIYAVDVSSVFSSLAAGDYCGLQITLNTIGDGLNVLGVHLRYE